MKLTLEVKRILPVVLLLFLAIVMFICLAYGQGWIGQPAAPELSTQSSPIDTPVILQEPDPEADGLPHDKLFITVERQNYKSGDLRLIIPKLSIDAPVWNGTTKDCLSRGACLYEYAQLPGEGNRNVSIAAHRNGRRYGKVTDDGLFYYIDTLAEGDFLYLSDAENIYRYLYKNTTIVEADDWSPIYCQGFSCLTLTSCEPIGISTHRIIVRGKLEEIIPLTGDYQYLPGV